MNPSVPTKSEMTVPSLFQIAAFFEDFFPAGGLKKLAPALNQIPFADLMLHPEKLRAVLKSAKTQNHPAGAARPKLRNSIKRTTRSGTSKKRGNYAGSPIGNSLCKLKKIEFSLAAPSATSVRLAADFTDWERFSVEMMHSGDGFWFTVVPLPSGLYAYRFIVDGQWCDDPRSTQRVLNPFGTENAVVLVT